jgi:hypothetical protein
LKEIFGIDNTSISFAKKQRIDKQYYVASAISEKEVKEMIRNAEIFNANIVSHISNLNSESISKYREEFKKLIK